MIKSILIAAALLVASPSLALSQDFFWSFESASLSTSTTLTVGDTRTAYIFSDGLTGFDAIDLNFETSDSAVLLLTGGTAFNDPFEPFFSSPAFNSSTLTIDANGAAGNLFSVSSNGTLGINPGISPNFNPHFEAGVGPSGAVLLASVDYRVVGEGVADLEFSLGPQGAVVLPLIVFEPTFGAATVTVAGVPEPSTAVLLALGAAGMVVRRRRSQA